MKIYKNQNFPVPSKGIENIIYNVSATTTTTTTLVPELPG